jgi:hypothetical protein
VRRSRVEVSGERRAPRGKRGGRRLQTADDRLEAESPHGVRLPHSRGWEKRDKPEYETGDDGRNEANQKGMTMSMDQTVETTSRMRIGTAAAAQHIGVTPRELKEMRRARKFAFYRLGHRTVSYTIADLDAFLARSRVEALVEYDARRKP